MPEGLSSLLSGASPQKLQLGFRPNIVDHTGCCMPGKSHQRHFAEVMPEATVELCGPCGSKTLPGVSHA